jgi:hypothetical protein
MKAKFAKTVPAFAMVNHLQKKLAVQVAVTPVGMTRLFYAITHLEIQVIVMTSV